MKTYNLMDFKGYPMYQKAKLTNRGINKINNETFGDSTIDIVVTKPLEIGDVLLRHTEKHTVSEIQETRPARGEHKELAIFQKVLCKYVNQLPQE